MDFIKDMIATRGAQLLARYVAMGLVALATKLGVELNADDASGGAKVVGVLVAAGICSVIDHFSHKKQAE